MGYVHAHPERERPESISAPRRRGRQPGERRAAGSPGTRSAAVVPARDRGWGIARLSAATSASRADHAPLLDRSRVKGRGARAQLLPGAVGAARSGARGKPAHGAAATVPRTLRQ